MRNIERKLSSFCAVARIIPILLLFTGCEPDYSTPGVQYSGPFCAGGGVAIDSPTGKDLFITKSGSIMLAGGINTSEQYATWHNAATGESGTASQSNSRCDYFPFYPGYVCLSDWAATISLAYGNNFINVAGNPASGWGGGDCITIARIPNAHGLALDAVHNEVFVVRPLDALVATYTRTDSGAATPKRILSGATTGLNYPKIIAVDAANDEVFVVAASSSAIMVYPGTANGDTAPLRTISREYGTGTAFPAGLAIDTVNNEVFVTYRNDDDTTRFIDVIARTASGSTRALRTLSESSADLKSPMCTAVDAVNNELFVVNIDDRITVYDRTATGSAAPIRTIAGASTGLNAPYGITVDTVNNELFVTSAPASIIVFARTANGNAAPIRTIKGASTGLTAPQDIAVDVANNEIFVTDGSTVLVYSRTASGNAAPIRTITY